MVGADLKDEVDTIVEWLKSNGYNVLGFDEVCLRSFLYERLGDLIRKDTAELRTELMARRIEKDDMSRILELWLKVGQDKLEKHKFTKLVSDTKKYLQRELPLEVAHGRD